MESFSPVFLITDSRTDSEGWDEWVFMSHQPSSWSLSPSLCSNVQVVAISFYPQFSRPIPTSNVKVLFLCLAEWIIAISWNLSRARFIFIGLGTENFSHLITLVILRQAPWMSSATINQSTQTFNKFETLFHCSSIFSIAVLCEN